MMWFVYSQEHRWEQTSTSQASLDLGGSRGKIPEIVLVHKALPCSRCDDNGGKRKFAGRELGMGKPGFLHPQLTERPWVISSHCLWTLAQSCGFQKGASSFEKNTQSLDKVTLLCEIPFYSAPWKLKPYCQRLLPWRNLNSFFVCWAECTHWINHWGHHGPGKVGEWQTCAGVRGDKNIEKQSCEAPAYPLPSAFF